MDIQRPYRPIDASLSIFKIENQNLLSVRLYNEYGEIPIESPEGTYQVLGRKDWGTKGCSIWIRFGDIPGTIKQYIDGVRSQKWTRPSKVEAITSNRRLGLKALEMVRAELEEVATQLQVAYLDKNGNPLKGGALTSRKAKMIEVEERFRLLEKVNHLLVDEFLA